MVAIWNCTPWNLEAGTPVCSQRVSAAATTEDSWLKELKFTPPAAPVGVPTASCGVLGVWARMVPVPVASATVGLSGSDTLTKKVLLGVAAVGRNAPALTYTVTVADVEPGAKVTVP